MDECECEGCLIDPQGNIYLNAVACAAAPAMDNILFLLP